MPSKRCRGCPAGSDHHPERRPGCRAAARHRWPVVVCSADILKGARSAGGVLLVLIDARTAAQGAEVVPVVACPADILKGARSAGGVLLVLIDARTAAQGAEVVPVVVCAADILKGARAAGGVLLVLIDARTPPRVPRWCRWWCALLYI